MPERILQDPHLKVMPDHSSPHHAILQAALTQNGMSEEEAMQMINNSWTQAHNKHILLWDQQVANNAEILKLQQEEEQQCAAQQAREKELELAEVWFCWAVVLHPWRCL